MSAAVLLGLPLLNLAMCILLVASDLTIRTEPIQ